MRPLAELFSAASILKTDAMALHFCKEHKDTYIACLFPVVAHYHHEVEKLLASAGTIVYTKEVVLCNNGPFHFIKKIYKGEHWLGNKENNFAGAQLAVHYKFAHNTAPMQVYLFQCESLQQVVAIKTKIRTLCKVGNAAIHINDTHQETIDLSLIVFDEKSIHQLNNR